MAESEFNGIEFNDSLVVEPDECIYQGEYNPHNKRPWLIHLSGCALCVVFAYNEQEALDEAADHDRLQGCEMDGGVDEDADENEYTRLGNDSALYDLTHIQITELPIPKRSFCAQFNES